MKILWATNSSMMLEPTITCLDDKHHATHFFYDKPNLDQFEERILEKVIETEPDITFFIGGGNGPWVADSALLKRVRALTKTKFIHLCTDAACPGWWDTLNLYAENQCFDLTVSLDGSYDVPRGTIDLVTLTPPNESFYKPIPWSERTIELGFMGGLGSSERQRITSELEAQGHLTINRNRSEEYGSYQSYANWIMNCKGVLNFARTGSEKTMHVKNRAIEAGLARALLIEQEGSPLQNWFIPQYEYLTWPEPQGGKANEIADRYHTKLLTLYSAKQWFDRILNKL